jgi:acyl phosphate:glycerol-3-phosphate acyltransferase
MPWNAVWWNKGKFMEWLIAFALVVGAYLIGSISFAVVVSKAFGLADPRHYGSGNPGATNVLRTGNKKAAILTLLGDGVKGYVGGVLPSALAAFSALPAGYSASSAGTVAVVLAPLAAVIGHMFPVFHGFKGGKGVAGGAMFAVHWALGLATVASWAAVAFVWRMSSLASIAACALTMLYGMLFFDLEGKLLAVGVISILVIWRHSENIGRLLAGTESKIGKKTGTQAGNQAGSSKKK